MKEAVTGVTGKRIFSDHWVYIDTKPEPVSTPQKMYKT
jgi:hypothetical protein